MLEDIFWWGVTAFYLLGWLLYFRENKRYRDAVADLCQLMHDYDVPYEDLRRTEDHKKLKWYWDRD